MRESSGHPRAALDFVWAVESDGYALVREVVVHGHTAQQYNPETGVVGIGASALVKPKSDEWLCPVGGSLRTITPLNEDGLHRKFAELPVANRSFLAFANSYGLLGPYAWLLEHPNSHHTIGEPVEHWKLEVIKLRFLVRLWDQLREGGSDLDDHLRGMFDLENTGSYRDEDGRPNSRFGPEPFANCAEASEHGLIIVDFERCYATTNSYLRHGLSIKPEFAADLFLREQINRVLALHVSAALRGRNSRSYSFVAKNLLGAIYLSFANEVLGQAREMRKCDGCGKWFYPKTGKQQHCSGACRQRVYRKGVPEETNNV